MGPCDVKIQTHRLPNAHKLLRNFAPTLSKTRMTTSIKAKSKTRPCCPRNHHYENHVYRINISSKNVFKKLKSACLKLTYGLFGNDYRVVTHSKVRNL